MNKQIGYITSAHLILFSIAASYFFISKISSASNNQDQVNQIDHVTTVKEKVLSGEAVKGKTLFMSNCGSCHHVFKETVGPALAGFEKRGPWPDRKKLYTWIRDPKAFMQQDPYTKALKEKYDPTIMNPSPQLTNEEIDFIVAYIKESE